MNKKFNDLNHEVRENLLMETAMRIMEIFDDMSYACQVDPDKVDSMGSIERLQLFGNWAREFEELYYDTDKYNDDFIELSDKFAQKKINEVFGIDN